jgi:hypothetical protein
MHILFSARTLLAYLGITEAINTFPTASAGANNYLGIIYTLGDLPKESNPLKRSY